MFVKLYLSLVNVSEGVVSVVPLPLVYTFFMETIFILPPFFGIVDLPNLMVRGFTTSFLEVYMIDE